MKRHTSLVVPGIILVILLAGSLIIVLSLSFMSPARNFRVMAVLKTVNPGIEFWASVKSGILTAAKDYDLDLRITGPWDEIEIDELIEAMDAAIAEKPAAIILAAAEFNALVPSVEKAHRAGIVVITLDSGVNSSVPLCFVATDNVEAGEKAGRAMLDLVEPGRKVAIVNHIRGVSTATDRETGVLKVLRKKGTNPFVGTFYTDNFEERAYANTKEIVEKHPDIGGIFALNEVSTVGVAKALSDLGLGGKIRVVGFDSPLSVIKFIEEGVIDATVVQKPFNMGYLSVKKTWEALGRKPVERFIDTGSILITRENMYAPENQKILFPFVKPNE